MATEEELKKLREASEKSAAKAKALLDEEVKTIMNEVMRIDELKPQTADQETYDKIIKVVQEANNKNYSVAMLKENIEKLGEGAISLFKEMASIAKKLV
jgi:uncharacterized coiled-coil DUF342 family protein